MANNTKNKTMTTSFTNSKQISKQIRLLTTTALFAALITIFTAYIGHVPVGTNGGYIKDVIFSKNGFAPHVASGSESTYYCDGLWYNNEITDFAMFGGDLRSASLCGSLHVDLNTTSSYAFWHIGASSSYK